MPWDNEKVTYPQSRHRIIAAIDDLRDYEYQLKAWIKPTAHHFFWENILFPEDTILEEFDFDENDYEYFKDDILLNEQEFLVCQKIGKLLYRVIKEIGTEQPDSAYVDAPLWMEVVKAAQIAWNFFKQQGEDKEYIDALEEDREIRIAKFNNKPHINQVPETNTNKTISKDNKDLKLPGFDIDTGE